MRLESDPGLPGLPEHLTVGRRLGSGAFGTVYEAHDRNRGRPVALKVLKRSDPHAVYQFKREFRGLVDLAHPNLVALHELFAIGAGWGFTMELVEGTDFRSHVLGNAREPATDATGSTQATAASRVATARSPAALDAEQVRRARGALAQLAGGLRALHDSGKLHCDLKPSNVLVSPQGRVVLVDFGLVRELGLASLDAEGGWGGTPAYVAPEQAAGEPPTEACDWYSLGVMLFEVLTGDVPFTGSARDVLTTKRSFDPPAPSSLVRGVPEDLDRLCRTLLRVRPQDRAGGREVERALWESAGPPRSPLSSSPSSARFVGRAPERASLAKAFAEVERGRPARVTITGESGVGKSTLAHRFLDDLRTQHPDVVILEGRCHFQDGVPYKALDGLVDALSVHLSRLEKQEAQAILSDDHTLIASMFPVLGGVLAPAPITETRPNTDAAELRQRVLRAVRAVFSRLANRGPLVLFVDDLQWGDADSASLLSGLLHGAEAPPLLFLACERGAGPDATSDGGRRLVLEGLTPAEAGWLARTLLQDEGDALGAQVETITDESAGSPYLLQELVQAHRERRDAPLKPASVEMLVDARVSSLPPLARRYLELVAVAGQPLQIDVARAAAGVGPEEEPLTTLLKAQRLLRAGEARKRFCVEPYHDRIRRAVLASVSADLLRAHHRDLATTWERLGGADPELLAHHHDGAGNPQRAAVLSVQAAAQASAVLAFDRAAGLYRRALALDPAAHGTAVRRALADALVNAGQVEEAAGEYLACAQAAPPDEALSLRVLAAEQLLRGGRTTRGLATLEEVLTPLGLSMPRTLPGVALSWMRWRLRGWLEDRRASRPAAPSPRDVLKADACWTVAHGLALLDVPRAAVFQARHLVLVRGLGDEERESRALALETTRLSLRGSRTHARTQRLLTRAREKATSVGAPRVLARMELAEGAAAFCEGRWRQAADQLGRAEVAMAERCVGLFWELSMARMFGCASLYFLGELRTLKQRLSTLLESARARGNLHEVATLSFRSVHSTLLADDRPDEARTQLGEVMALWPPGRFYSPHWWACVGHAETALYVGEPGAALEALRGGWGSLRASRLVDVQYVRIYSRFRRAQCTAAVARSLPSGVRRRWLLAAAERDAVRLAREGAAWAVPLSQLVSAGIDLARGDPERAVPVLAQAETALRTLDMTLFAAATRAWRGDLIGGEGGRSLTQEAETVLRAEGVVHPGRMRRMLVPS